MTTDTTPAAIEALLKDVTPGPWDMETVRTSCGVCHKVGPWPHQWRHGADMSACIYDDYPSPAEGTNAMLANARFIAAARDLVPALAAERDAALRERDEARRDARFYEFFGDHASVVRGIIAAAGDLPTLSDGPFKEGFFSGIEEVAARADIQADDGNRQMQALMNQIADLVQGNATLIMVPAGEYVNAIARAEKAETDAAALRDEVARMRGLADRKKFPILGCRGVGVDWQLVADHGGQANTNHGQTVARLAERGGLSWCELFAVLHNRRWEKMDANDAMIACRALETRYLAALAGKGGEG